MRLRLKQLQELENDELRILVAELLGWTSEETQFTLDSMHKAEKVLSEEDDAPHSKWEYYVELQNVFKNIPDENGNCDYWLVMATTRQRAIAFILTMEE